MQNIPFSGSSDLGNSGTIAPGLGWNVNQDGWGTPGVNLGTLIWPTLDNIIDFHIQFELPLDVDVVFQQAANCAGSSGGGTTFCSSPFGTPWTAVSDGADAISFYAPAGEQLNIGESFFVNVFFTGGQEVDFGSFQGSWSTAAVPEPASIALLGLGLAALGVARRRKQ